MTRQDRVQELRAAYQLAFDEWAYATTRLQLLLRSNETGGAIADARSRVSATYANYRQSRDLLAAQMVHATSTKPVRLCIVPSKTPPVRSQRVKTMSPAVHR